MHFTTHKNNFNSGLPESGSHFGNIITIREKDGNTEPGIHQGFLASIIQFQPLLEINLFQANEQPLLWKQIECRRNPGWDKKIYTADGFTLEQKTAVHGDRIILDVKLTRVEVQYPKAQPVLVHFSGGVLFSPQGVPYHWEEEKLIKLACSDKQSFRGEWNDEVSFDIIFSEKLNAAGMKILKDEEIAREQYFTSFNLKKRYTYHVPFEHRKDMDASRHIEARNIGYKGEWIPVFDQNNSASISCCISISHNTDAQVKSFPVGIDEEIKDINREWEAFLKQVPYFSCPETGLQNLYYTSWYILKSGRINLSSERFKYPFTSVNKFHYYNQFFWDSAFQAVAWLWFNSAEPAEDEMKNFVLQQWRNGMIPYELFMYKVNGREWMDGDFLTSGTTQPPVIGITIMEIYYKFQNRDYLDFFYDALIRYEHWFYQYRDLKKRGLSAYVNIWETGWDNSPRLDSSARNRVLDPYIEGVDLNSYIYLLRQTILDMAKWLEKPVPEDIRKRLDMSKNSMNTLMLDEENNFYYDLEAGTAEKIEIKTAAGLLPLMTDIPDDELKDRIVETYVLSEQEFLTPTPVPSVSRSEKTYDPKDFWRGANWPQITWSIVYGLRYSHQEAAGIILDRFLETTSKNSNCYEYYHSETGEGAGLPFQGWGALYTDFIIRFVGGLNPTEEGVIFNPVSKKYTEFELGNIRIHNQVLDISRKGKNWAMNWHDAGIISFSGIDRFQIIIADDGITVLLEKKEQEEKMNMSGKISVRYVS